MTKSSKNDTYDVDVNSLKTDIERGEIQSVDDIGEVHRGLSSRHLQFIALCGSIGTALFVGSGIPLSTCGPAPLLISYLVVCCAVYFIMNFLSEMVCWLPVKGISPANMVSRYAEPSMGFACGWTYWYSYAILVASENTAAAMVIQYWVSNERVNIGVWITIFWIVMVIVNFCAVKYYGESEFWFGIIKLSCIIGLIICGIVIFFGGAPTHDRLGFRYWQHPGSFAEHLVKSKKNTARFLDVWTAIVRSSLAFVLGPELIITSSGEVERPRYNIAKASRRFIWRLIFFYILGVIVITVTVAYNDKHLIGAINAGKSGAGASPFVIGIKNAGIPVLNHIVNAVIFLSALSSGNAFLYASSRCLVGLAKEGSAPKFFAKTNRFGTPYFAVSAGAAMGLLGYLNVSNSSATVFYWLTNIITIGGFFGWICCGIAYLRWRKAISYNQLESRVSFRTPFQPYGTWFAILFFSVVAITNGYEVFFSWNTLNFFAAYVSFPFFFILYFGHKIWFKTPWLYKISDIDVTTGLAEIEEEEANELLPPAPKNIWEKVLQWLF
ncbi:uncharacterized protein PRCAT00004231001 [Priceomyces carsonii]|uniref:uncharacterized protein n=1 Tax=Priceomyces carsonii TaxID=28549 RepID=UPI002ED7E579|nr:unnamed protein product [Priceomyces carsonii]